MLHVGAVTLPSVHRGSAENGSIVISEMECSYAPKEDLCASITLSAGLPVFAPALR